MKLGDCFRGGVWGWGSEKGMGGREFLWMLENGGREKECV